MAGTEVSKWADSAMYVAEVSDASLPPQAFLLGAPADPLGQIAAAALMYEGVVIRDLADVTDEQRRHYLGEIQKTALKMPLETVSLHFIVEGVHRGITHQWVRQRTAAYAQESTRFAVKEDIKTAVALPVSLRDTISLGDAIDQEFKRRREAGLVNPEAQTGLVNAYVWDNATPHQRARFRWDQAVENMGDAYKDMINSGIPAEDARGIFPTNVVTRLHYISNLRNFYDMLSVRVSDQAQFEWRQVAMALALAMREFGKKHFYEVKRPTGFGNRVLSSEWQYVALTEEIKPIEFVKGGPAFGAKFDRPSRIGERVRAFASRGVPSSEWTKGSPEHGIPPIHPEEWLFDPNSARLAAGMEFDVFGNRLPAGTGYHWVDGKMYVGGNPIGPAAVWPQDFGDAQNGGE